MEILVTTREGSNTGVRTRYEVVVYNVGIAVSLSVSSNVATTSSPVINNL
jgi:hypothetical protein